MNEILALANSRSRNRKYNKYNLVKREWDEIIAAIVASENLVPYTVPVWVHFDFYTNRRRDFNNIEASQKFILDGLIESGVIPSDSQKCLMPGTYSYHPPKEGVSVIVTLCNYPMFRLVPISEEEVVALA
jgi:hypothetical protein